MMSGLWTISSQASNNRQCWVRRGGGTQHIYGEVSPILLGQDIVKSDIFGSKEN